MCTYRLTAESVKEAQHAFENEGTDFLNQEYDDTVLVKLVGVEEG